MKVLVRRTLQDWLRCVHPEVAASAGRQACRRLTASREFRSASVVMLYLPIAGEIDISDVAESAWRRGKTVLGPRVDWDRKRMTAVEIRSLTDGIVRHRGVPNPCGGDPWPLEEIDLIVVPGLAFDRRGFRLGRGGGFYDRFLAHDGLHAITCGLAFHQQLVALLPTGRHDIPVHMLVTDRRITRFDRRP